MQYYIDRLIELGMNKDEAIKFLNSFRDSLSE